MQATPRADLSPAQEADHIRRRQVIWERRRQASVVVESGTICSTLPSTGRGNQQFAAEVATVTGASKQDVNRKIARARELGPDIQRVAGTSLEPQLSKSSQKV